MDSGTRAPASLASGAAGVEARHLEIEAKYRVTAPISPDAVPAALGAPYSVSDLADELLADELVDTADQVLAQHGYALRRRRRGGTVLVTLKGSGSVSGAVHARTEVEAAAGPDAAEGQWPEPIWADVRELVDGAPLQVIATVSNHRRAWRVVREGVEVAELALDEGVIRAGGHEEPFREIEVEQRGAGTAEDVAVLGARLAVALPLEPEPRSKFARAIALLNRRAGPAVAGATADPSARPMITVGREVVARNLEKLAAAEPVARDGVDPEGVHQMRVATRRLRAALQVLEDTIADARRTRRFRRGLRALANSAGAVRDADVFLEHLHAYAADVGDEEAMGLGPLLNSIERQRRRGRKALLRALDDRATRRLLRDIERWASRAGAGAPRPDAGPQPIWLRHYMRSAIWRRYEEILAYETVMPAPSPILHRLRVSVKRMRYTVEFFEEALGEPGRALLKRLASIQDHLGAIQDADVAIWAIDALARQRRGTAALQAYRDVRRRHQETLLEEFLPVWRELCGRDFRARLSDLLL